jgi:RNA polymerase sigma-70 factor (ECF subfamily)
MKPSECKDIFAILSQYLDRELPEEICHDIDAHIAGCPPCVQFVESLRKTVGLCRSFQSSEAPGPLPDTARDELLAAYHRMVAARRR